MYCFFQQIYDSRDIVSAQRGSTYLYGLTDDEAHKKHFNSMLTNAL